MSEHAHIHRESTGCDGRFERSYITWPHSHEDWHTFRSRVINRGAGTTSAPVRTSTEPNTMILGDDDDDDDLRRQSS